ncbi:hypothetical protein NW768_010398 [Fusarium equiseti]|uniref:Uncharacterized protein n=1 Tax=Fusarium equiseti TaxID=61235 RepID=A0ABQ8R137_FUSEQ|nr:hypothetical protein NW768_010398 [Fusarium equiseti]
MGNCMCKSSKGNPISKKRNNSPYSPPAPPPSQEQSQEQFVQSHDAAPRLPTPVPQMAFVNAFDDDIVEVGDARYIPPDVTRGPWGMTVPNMVDAMNVQREDRTFLPSYPGA